MPIQRFGSMLISKGQFNAYMRLREDTPATKTWTRYVPHLLSRRLAGFLYDCDFNQMLGLPLELARKITRRDLRDLLPKTSPTSRSSSPIIASAARPGKAAVAAARFGT